MPEVIKSYRGEGRNAAHAGPAMRSTPALRHLRAEARAALDAASEQVDVSEGAWVMHQGEFTSEIYFIVEGEVVLIQAAIDGHGEETIARLGPGEWFGEMALIDGGPRALAARASQDCTLTKISPTTLEQRDDGAQILADLRGAMGVLVVERMRQLNRQHIEGLRRQLQSAKLQQQFGHFFIYVLTIYCMGMLASNAIATGLIDVDVTSLSFVLISTLIVAIPSVIVILLMQIPLSQMGITTHRLIKSTIEGLAASGVVVVLIIGVALLLRMFDALPATPRMLGPVVLCFYFAHCIFQELLVRGVLQTSLQTFLKDDRGLTSVFLTAVIFGTLHVHVGLAAVGLTFIAGLFFGLFYLRHFNLAGVTLVHFFAGVTAFATGLL